LIQHLLVGIITVGLSVFVYHLLPKGENGLSFEAITLASVFISALVLWITELFPISVTAMIIIALTPLLGVFRSVSEATAGFTNPVVFL